MDANKLIKKIESLEAQLKQQTQINEWFEIYSTYIYKNFWRIDQEASEIADEKTNEYNF